MAKQTGLWRTEKNPELHLLKQIDEKKIQRVKIKALLLEWRELRKQGRCGRCNGHPHCGVWGHEEKDCLLEEKTKDCLCASCAENLGDVDTIMECERCRLYVHGEDVDVSCRKEWHGYMLCGMCRRAGRDEKAPGRPTGEPDSGGAKNVTFDEDGNSTREFTTVEGEGAFQVLVAPSTKRGGVQDLESDADEAVGSKRKPSDFLADGVLNVAHRGKMRATGAPATTGAHTMHDVMCGLRGLDVAPLEVKNRPLCPRDFLTHNVSKTIDDGGSQRLIFKDGEMVAENKKKVMECVDAVEWAACDMKLERYYRATKQLKEEESDSYQRHRLRVMDLSRTRKWAAVLEYDYLVRWSVWRGQAVWADLFTQEYECAFTAKAGAAMLGHVAKYCHVCHSADHNAGDSGCIFRAPGANDSTGYGGGNGRNGGVTKKPPGKPSGGNGGSPNRATVGPNDQLRGIYFFKIDGKKVCIGWNKNDPGEPCATPCAKGFEHRCSYCKDKGHRSSACSKLKLDHP